MRTRKSATLHPHLPWRVVPSLGVDVFLGRERTIARDARAMRRALGRERLVLSGVANLPKSGAVVLVANHLQGPGLWIGWAAGAITDAVARWRAGDAVHWTVSTGYDRETVGGAKKLLPLTNWAFPRVAHAWGMVTVEPGRAGTALRKLVPVLDAGGVAGIFPEGAVQGLAGLHPVPAGTLRALDFLARRAVLLPVASTVHEGRMHVQFGPPSTSAGEAWRFIESRVRAVEAPAESVAES